MTGIIPPRTDLLFKRIFGDPSNTDILVAFLKAALPLPAEDFTTVTLTDTNLPVDQLLDKESILDINATTTSGRQIDIEIQVLPFASLKERVTFYTARMLAHQLKAGHTYTRLNQAISILITAHDLIHPSTAYQHRFHLAELATGITFTTVMEINTLELTKLPPASDGTELWEWLTFINASNQEELDMAATLNPTIDKAATIVRYYSADEAFRLQAESRDKWQRDVATMQEENYTRGRVEGIQQGIQQGIEQGIEQGMEQGIDRERVRGIRHGLAQGYDAVTLAAIFQISQDEVHRLAGQ